MAMRDEPPFRGDQVGSLLRPPELRQARARRQAGELSADALTDAENAAIEAAIARQRDVGLRAVTDGEMRRSMWHFDFLEGLDGVEGFETEHGIAFQGGLETKHQGLRVTGKLGFSGHPMVGHFEFVRDHSGGAVPKMTIPSPSVLHYRGGRAAVSERAYPDMADFFTDLGDAYREAVVAFGAAGCRYLQLDDTNFAYLCDPEQRAMLAGRGDDPDTLPGVYASLINRALEGRPAGMRVTMHLCRGNFRSSWIASGGYEPVAERLFNDVGVDAYFLEYDTERAGGFQPLRHLPAGKQVVLGLVTTKSGELESPDGLLRRIDEASQYADPEALCLSPQCGFSSTEEGNLISETEQWRKLELVVTVAERAWGRA
jgi:5-methyltetrahydropteroyltriglutamate--homocysteine methyltransferase